MQAFFAPGQKRSYKISVPIEAVEDFLPQNLGVGYHIPGSGLAEPGVGEQTSRSFLLEVRGEGADGSIQISQDEIDFKTVKIGEQRKLQVTLKNSSACAFFI